MAASTPAQSLPALPPAARCFNPLCREPKIPVRRRGWRLRSGELAFLCDRCSAAYEQGVFCLTFHQDFEGWRNCESCGKKLHCGCIVSSNVYLFLDYGGVDCIQCARKSLVMAPNQMWSSTSHVPIKASERSKDFPTKGWNSVSVYPRTLNRIWNLATTQSDLNRRLSYELDGPISAERFVSGTHSSIFGQENKMEDFSKRKPASSVNPTAFKKYANGSTKPDSTSSFSAFVREVEAVDAIQNSVHILHEIDPVSVRKDVSVNSCTSGASSVKLDAYLSSQVKNSLPTSASKVDSSSSTDQLKGNAIEILTKQLKPKSENLTDGDLQSHACNGRLKMDARGRSHLLPRYVPRISEQELKQISGDSKSTVLPLFEKMLSASDAGKIGRLVLPKKCAETYFPIISHPEGVPLKVQDIRGTEWTFQFRFWPNNNSRMYVLEGVTPCIQSMQLQAGDIVTFSRINPEGKLLLGCRKTSSVSAEQEYQAIKAESSVLISDINNGINSSSMENHFSGVVKGKEKNPVDGEDQQSESNIDKAGFIGKDGSNNKYSPNRRKANALGPKSKRLHIENEDSIELKLTWLEAQELLRPYSHPWNIISIDGHEVEEYEEAPLLGMPTISTTNESGEHYQWVQCEDCFKWRRLPGNASLIFRWTCSDNKWDPERSSCAAYQELDKAQLALLLPANTGASKRLRTRTEPEGAELSDGLDTLANLAILGEGETSTSSSQNTTRHPRHRPGCTCIVCIQPPSGKGPKHKDSCDCIVCQSAKRRFQTWKLKRASRQSEKLPDTSHMQLQSDSPVQMLPVGETLSPSKIPGIMTQEAALNKDGTVDNQLECRKQLSSLSPLKNQIDLNIQPE